MEVVTVDSQGRIVIRKPLREKKKLTREVELIEVSDGILLRPRRGKGWSAFLDDKIKVEWKNALAVSLDAISVDDLLFG